MDGAIPSRDLPHGDDPGVCKNVLTKMFLAAFKRGTVLDRERSLPRIVKSKDSIIF